MSLHGVLCSSEWPVEDAFSVTLPAMRSVRSQIRARGHPTRFPCPVMPPRLLSTLVPRRTGGSFLALPRALFLLRRQSFLPPAPSLIPCCLLCCLLWLPHPSSQPGIRSPVPRPQPHAQHPCEPTVFPGYLPCPPPHPGPRTQPCPAPVAEPKCQMCHSQKWFLPPETFGRCVIWHVMHFWGQSLALRPCERTRADIINPLYSDLK